MKAKKMPPMCVRNGLKLTESDYELKEQKLEMTELKEHNIPKDLSTSKIKMDSLER